MRGQRITDDSFVLFFNAHHEPIDFTLPEKKFGASWIPVIYTADDVNEESKPYDAGTTGHRRLALGDGAAGSRA